MTEFQLHKAAAEYLRTVLMPEVLWTHIPMQGTADARRGAILKSMGAQAGWPDFLLIFDVSNKKSVHTTRVLGIEMKAPKGRLSEPQEDVGGQLNRCVGGSYVICRSVRDVEHALVVNGVPVRGRIAA